MSILNGTGTTQPKGIWYGNNKIKEVWVGANKVWPLLVGPYLDADLYLNFNNPDSTLENLGIEAAPVLPEGGMMHDHDNLFVANTGKLKTSSNSTWDSGYTVSMWTRDAPVNSGWRTIMHRAISSGALTNEVYVVQDTNASVTTINAGLRLGGTVRQFAATYKPPVGSGWFHTVVVWTRTSSTAFNCKFYIDGVLRGSNNATGFPANNQMQPTYPIFFGAGRDNDGFEWSGNMDDVALWSRGLTNAEVTELYTIGRSWIPRITTESPMAFAVGDSGSMTLTTDFGATTWIATGSMPLGLTLSGAGVLSGTPTTVGSGVMILTASSDLYSATKAITWAVIEVPALTQHSIKARSASKVSHSGWNRPGLTWDLLDNGGGSFTSNGDLIVKYGRGRVWSSPAMVNTRNTRVVSNLKGVVASGGVGNANYYSPNMTFSEGERLYLEVENFSSNTNDAIKLYVVPPV